jgi:hypothetical protein
MTNYLLIDGKNIGAFPHILGSPSSCMTFDPIPSEENFVFFFVSASWEPDRARPGYAGTRAGPCRLCR